MNNGGYLTTYIKNQYSIDIPTLYDRREYYKLTGSYWWEQWFDIVKIEKQVTKNVLIVIEKRLILKTNLGHLNNIYQKYIISQLLTI